MLDAGGDLAVLQWDHDMEESGESFHHTGGDLGTLQCEGDLEEYADLLQEHGMEDESCLPEGGGRRSRIIRTSLDPAKPPAEQQVQQAALHGGASRGPAPAVARGAPFRGSVTDPSRPPSPRPSPPRTGYFLGFFLFDVRLSGASMGRIGVENLDP